MKNFSLENNEKIKSGFKIPENYFENFTVSLPQNTTKVIPLWKKAQRKTAGIAAVVLLSISIPVLDMYMKNKQENLHNEIENYLVYNAELTTDELSEFYNSTNDKSPDFSNIKTEDIENQLLENNLENYILE